MIQAAQIREHMDVVGSDGGHVGRVDKVMGDEIELTKLDIAAGLKHHDLRLRRKLRKEALAAKPPRETGAVLFLWV